MGIKISDMEKNSELLIKHLNMVNKLIERKKYAVNVSKKINEREYSNDIKKIIDVIKWKFENEYNLNSYLSTKIFSPNYYDVLLNDWGIYHLHLSNKSHAKNPFFINGQTICYLFLLKVWMYIFWIFRNIKKKMYFRDRNFWK